MLQQIEELVPVDLGVEVELRIATQLRDEEFVAERVLQQKYERYQS